jgi:hypothetical protein
MCESVDLIILRRKDQDPEARDLTSPSRLEVQIPMVLMAVIVLHSLPQSARHKYLLFMVNS